MKANEIMVWDYLRVNRDGICIPEGKIVRVTEVDSENYFLEKGLKGSARCEAVGDPWLSGGIWCDYLDPIPLTPEILEKNTSESNKNVFGGMNYALNADFFIENRGDRFCLSRRMAGHKYSTFWICDIHFVHQLQHCLKLVGIEKEIVI